MAGHYGTAILPARPRSPAGQGPSRKRVVLVVQRWILAKIRNQTSFSSMPLTNASRIFVSNSTSDECGYTSEPPRAARTPDKAALGPLPKAASSPESGRRRGVQYRLPYRIRSSLLFEYQVHCWVRGGYSRQQRPVEIYWQRDESRGTPAACVGPTHDHCRHMPRRTQAHAEWRPSRILAWAGSIGPDGELAERFSPASHTPRGISLCFGSCDCRRSTGGARVELACAERCRSAHARTVMSNHFEHGLDHSHRRSVTSTRPTHEIFATQLLPLNGDRNAE